MAVVKIAVNDDILLHFQFAVIIKIIIKDVIGVVTITIIVTITTTIS